MTNIVVLCYERYRLTVQCIESIRKNTKPDEYTLTLVDDDSKDFRVRNFLRDQALYNPKNTTLLEVSNSRHCLGALKNLGVRHSELTFGRGEFLCILDNDVCVFPGWLDTLNEDDPNGSEVVLLGGVRHPFHGVNKEHEGWVETDAVAGYCHHFPWGWWDTCGPYDANASGIGQSEDFAFCQRLREYGPVGYCNPPVMAHCGITDSTGKPIAGAELIERVPGVLYL